MLNFCLAEGHFIKLFLQNMMRAFFATCVGGCKGFPDKLTKCFGICVVVGCSTADLRYYTFFPSLLT